MQIETAGSAWLKVLGMKVSYKFSPPNLSIDLTVDYFRMCEFLWHVEAGCRSVEVQRSRFADERSSDG